MGARVIEFAEALAAWNALAEEQKRLEIDPRGYVTMADVEILEGKTKSGRCPECGFVDRGFIRFDFPLGHPLFGAAVKCPRCW